MRNPFKRAVRTAPQVIATGNKFPELCNLVSDYAPGKIGNDPYIMQFKVDGIRALYIDGRIVSREGAPLDCCSHILPELQRVEAAAGCPLFIDMEYQTKASFDETDSERKRGVGTGIGFIFDGFPLDQWMVGGSFDPVERRLGRMKEWAMQSDGVNTHFLGGHVVRGDREAQTNATAAFRTQEGIVIKKIGSIYRRERTAEWLKLKKEIEQVCPVLDVLVKQGKFHGLLCKGPTGPLRITNGFSANEKIAFLALAQTGRDIDARVKLKWNEKAGSNAPRHAVFVSVAR